MLGKRDRTISPESWRVHRFGLPPERWRALRGKSFWVTGAGTGYGRSLSAALAAAGAEVFLTGRRLEKLRESLEEMKKWSIPVDRCRLVPADLQDLDQILRACREVREACPALYGLIHSAALPGKHWAHPLEEETLEYWEAMYRTNVTAPWLLTREILPHMAIAGGVRVLFLTSGAGWGFTPGYGPYNVTKAALNSLAGSMAEECAGSHPGVDIQMNALSPGEARTEMNTRSTESPYAVVWIALILLSHPAGGPNGKFFDRAGRSLEFGAGSVYTRPLVRADEPTVTIGHVP